MGAGTRKTGNLAADIEVCELTIRACDSLNIAK